MNEYISILIELVKENPELEIMHFVDYEVCCSDEHRYWYADIESVKIESVYDNSNEECFIIGENEIKENIELTIDGNEPEDEEPENRNSPVWKDFIQKKYNELIERGKVRKVILIKLGV